MEEKKTKKGNTQKNISLMKLFFPYLKKHLGTELMVLLCAMISAACEIILPLVVRGITDKGVENPAGLTNTLILQICFAYIALRGLDSLSSYCQSFWGHRMGTKIENAMREDMFDHLQTLSFTFFDNTKVGQLMSRMTSDLFDVAEWAHHFPEMVLMTVVKFVASFYIFADMDIRFAIAVFVLMPLMILLTKKSRTKMHLKFLKNNFLKGEI